MSRYFLISTLFTLLILAGASGTATGDWLDESTAPLERPNTVFVEFLGRGGTFSVNYDRLLSDLWAVGGGFSFGSSAGTSYFIFPVYGNYYFLTTPSRWFVTVGATISTLNQTVNSPSPGNFGGVGFNAGAGFEYRTQGGGFLRVAPYLLMYGGVASPWIGFSFGFSF
jgi:hypothetical protein